MSLIEAWRRRKETRVETEALATRLDLVADRLQELTIELGEQVEQLKETRNGAS